MVASTFKWPSRYLITPETKLGLTGRIRTREDICYEERPGWFVMKNVPIKVQVLEVEINRELPYETFDNGRKYHSKYWRDCRQEDLFELTRMGFFK
jgi:hypothetical protein